MDWQTLFYVLGVTFFIVGMLFIFILLAVFLFIYLRTKNIVSSVKTSFNIVSKIQEWKKQPLPIVASALTLLLGYFVKKAKVDNSKKA